MSSIYDYIMEKSSVELVLDYYNVGYSIRNNVAWLCCPFHSETEPSFEFFLDTKQYNCWGCKVKGNIITFIREIELLQNSNELSYYDSAVVCCKICNIKINLSYKEQLELELKQTQCDDISDILEFGNAVDNPQQEVFLESSISKFYVKKNSFMVDKGYSAEVLKYLEMGFYSGDTKNPMNNRCVFPVRNEQGKLVGWTGRSILSDAKIKWCHAPAKRFNKALNLYNIDKALPHIMECGCVNVVESIGNTIRMIESGRLNTVATLGSTISVEQCNMLVSYNVDIIFWYDWDSGGFAGLELALKYILNYDCIKIAVTDYGLNKNGKAKDIGDVSVSEVDNTKIVTAYEYLQYVKERYVSNMDNSFEKDTKIKLTDGNIVLCTNKINPKIEMPQLVPEDVNFFKMIDSCFGINELKLKE